MGGGGSGCEQGHVTSSLGTCCLLRPKFLLISSKKKTVPPVKQVVDLYFVSKNLKFVFLHY